MDSFALAIFIGLAVLSALPVDWQANPREAWIQVGGMSGGLIALLLYTLCR